jgi:hypothetical protein
MWLIQQGNPGRVIKWLGKTTIRHAIFDFQRHKLQGNPATAS